MQKTRIEGALIIVEARVSANLSSLPIEHVIGKRQRLLIEMARGMRMEVADELFKRPEWGIGIGAATVPR